MKKLILIILAGAISFSLLAAKKVCFVNTRAEADKVVTVVNSKETADRVIYLSDERHETGKNVWIKIECQSSEVKIYLSKTGEGKKIYFSKEPADKEF